MKKMDELQAKGKRLFKQIDAKNGEKITVGIDVHKRSYHVAVWSIEQEVLVASWVSPATAEAIQNALEPCRDAVERIVYEAGPTGYGLARSLTDAGWYVQVISPAHIPRSAVEEDKCDRIDAKNLARLAAKDELKAIYIPSVQEERDRELLRARERAMRQLRRVKCQIKSYLLSHGIDEPQALKHWTRVGIKELEQMDLPAGIREPLDDLLCSLSHFQKLAKRADERLRCLAKEERFAARIERMTVPAGVGVITSMAFLLETPNYHDLDNSRQVARLLGLSPRVRSSGEKTRADGRFHGGKSLVRKLLIEAAWQWRARDAWAFDRYRRYLSNTGSPQKAITALARKLAIVLWSIAKNDEPYCPGVTRIPEKVFEGMKRQSVQ